MFKKRTEGALIQRSSERTPFMCWFAGDARHPADPEERFRHYATFSKGCFSPKEKQMNISVFVDPDTDLPEWSVAATDLDGSSICNALSFYLDLKPCGQEDSGSKIGGGAHPIRGSQARRLEPVLTEKHLSFLMQIDEEDFFPPHAEGVDKWIRDALCGGAIYVFARIDTIEELIGADVFIVDHQM